MKPKKKKDSAMAIVRGLVRLKVWTSTSGLGTSVDAYQYSRLYDRAQALLRAKKGGKL